MPAGKIPPHILKRIVFQSLGASPEGVVVGPAIGEDAAVVKGDTRPLVIASDPVTGASKNIGIHAVHVNANDVASTGADPQFFMVTLLLKEDATEEEIRDITSQIHKACTEVGAAVVGGHTEFTSGIDRNIVSGTMFGYTDTPIRTGGASPGEVLILTKGAGIEGTSILAHEREEELLPIVGEEVLRRAKDFSTMLSVVPEAKILRKWATALHDPTEGGVAGALNEMAMAAGAGFSVDASNVPVRPETKAICDHLRCDPLQLISSGSLLAAIPKQDVETALSELSSASIDAWVIGTVTTEGTTLPLPDRDALWDVI